MNRSIVVLAVSLTLSACAGSRPRATTFPAGPAVPAVAAPKPALPPAVLAVAAPSAAPLTPAPKPATSVLPTPAKAASAPAAKPPAVPATAAGPAVAPRPGPAVIAPQPATTPAASAAPVPSAAAPPPLDLKSLEQRLRDTKAIGLFTKLALKNQVDDLLASFRGHHQGKPKPALNELRQNFDMLMLKVLSLLQDRDPTLAKAIVGSRDALWGILNDPAKLSAI